MFKTVKNRCQIVKKALVVCTGVLGTGQRVAISSPNPEQPSHVAFDHYYSGLCLNW